MCMKFCWYGVKHKTINQSVLVHPNVVAMSMEELETIEMAAYKVKTSAFINIDLLVSENEQDLYMIYKTQYKGGYMRYPSGA